MRTEGDRSADAAAGQLSRAAAEVYEEFFVPALFGQWVEPMLDAVSPVGGDRLLDIAREVRSHRLPGWRLDRASPRIPHAYTAYRVPTTPGASQRCASTPGIDAPAVTGWPCLPVRGQVRMFASRPGNRTSTQSAARHVISAPRPRTSPNMRPRKGGPGCGTTQLVRRLHVWRPPRHSCARACAARLVEHR
jgi:hypothetical protein